MDAIADTSFFIALEQERLFDADRVPNRLGISIVTAGELRAGVLAAHNLADRDRRLATLTQALALKPVPIDGPVAEAWATLCLALREANQRMPVNDSWIAATALAAGVPVLTQDDDYDVVPGLRVLKV